MQNHYNLIYREEEREMIPLCIDEGIGVIPWSPLARGFLAGNRKRDGGGETERARTDDNAQIALAWMLHKPGIAAPIIGASKTHHLEDAIAALEITMSADEIARLEE